MPLKWPSLPHIATKAISLLIFLATTILKCWDILTLYGQFDSHCIAGWEITDKVGTHLVLITMSLITDVAFVICIAVAMTFKLCNFGTDPGTIVYNFIVGVICLWSMFYITAIEDCGNAAIPIVKSVALLSLLAGVLHLLNGVVCLIFLAPEERTFPVRRPLNSEASSLAAT